MKEYNDYKHFSELDFMNDEYFQDWVIKPDELSNHFWNTFINEWPGKKEAVEKAKNLIGRINFKEEWPSDEKVQRSLAKVLEMIRQSSPGKVVKLQDGNKLRYFNRGFWAAAIVLIFISTGVYLYFNQTGKKLAEKTSAQNFKNDVSPGTNKAVLTLADGTQVLLDSTKNGAITLQGTTKIIKSNSGQIIYKSELPDLKSEIQYNTVTTPKGGQYQVILPDGTKAWLNAASSLKFPIAFTGKERNVELTGEGYFEVAKNASMPFNVSVGQMKVQVLGTHFNINAYIDETSIKTTLLEGSVKVLATGNLQLATVLKPGQQAQLQTKNYELRTINDVDLNEVMAWKDGFFEFENMELPAIMRQIERWYNVEVEYKRGTIKERFGGRISRNLNISNVLHLLEGNGIHFKIETNVAEGLGGKIIVL